MIELAIRKTQAERQAIIYEILDTQPDYFLLGVTDAGLDPRVDFVDLNLSQVNLSRAFMPKINLGGLTFIVMSIFGS